MGELSLYSPLCCSKPCRGTLERTSKTDKEDDKLLNNVVIFVFFAHKMCSRSFTTLRLTTEVTWTILMMSLLPFWALNMVVALLPMESQRALRFHQNILIYVPMMIEGFTGLKRHEGEFLG